MSLSVYYMPTVQITRCQFFHMGVWASSISYEKKMDQAKDSKEKEEEAENTFAPFAIRTHC